MSVYIASNGKVRQALPQKIALEEEYALTGVISRNQTYQNAENNQYNAGQQMLVYLPNECSDLRNCSMQFKINGTAYGAPATFTRFERGISSIFARFEVLMGSTQIMDIVNPDILKSIFKYNNPVNYVEGMGKVFEGTSANAATRNADFANPNRVYAVDLCGLGIFDKVLPLHKIASQLILRITLRRPEECLVTDDASAGNGTYVVVDPQFHYATLQMSAEWDQMYDQTIMERGGLNYTYKTWRNFQSTNALTAGVSNTQIVLPYRYSSLLGISAVMRTAANLNDPTFEGKNDVFNRNAVNFQRVKINSVYYPRDSTNSLADFLSQHADMYKLSYKGDHLVAVNFDTTSFINSTPLMLHPHEGRDVNGSLSGINTSSSGTSIVDEIKTSAPIAATQQLDYFACIEQTLRVLPNGAVQLYE